MERVETLVIGGGQAGLAMSYYLTQLGQEHLVLERARVAERWHSERWDSLMFQGPNWSIALPGHAYSGNDPDGFSHKDAIVRFIEDYATQIQAPVRTATNVVGLRAVAGSDRYLALSDQGNVEARNVVIATGPYQRPRIPRVSAGLPHDLLQLHASEYRNPGALPNGAVLVVGSGASGCQIADELLDVGRRVYLSVGMHQRVPRRYRGRDLFWWLRALGRLDEIVEELPKARRNVRLLFTGIHGGYDIDLRRSATRGMTLLGHLADARDGRLALSPDLEESLAAGDQAFEDFLRTADEYASKTGSVGPAPPGDANRVPAASRQDAILDLDLRAAGIHSVIWATGYSLDFGWVDLPIFDGQREPVQRRGATEAPGVYFLGLRQLYRQKSSFLAGVGDDAAHLAECIAERQGHPR